MRPAPLDPVQHPRAKPCIPGSASGEQSKCIVNSVAAFQADNIIHIYHIFVVC